MLSRAEKTKQKRLERKATQILKKDTIKKARKRAKKGKGLNDNEATPKQVAFIMSLLKDLNKDAMTAKSIRALGKKKAGKMIADLGAEASNKPEPIAVKTTRKSTILRKKE